VHPYDIIDSRYCLNTPTTLHVRLGSGEVHNASTQHVLFKTKSAWHQKLVLLQDGNEQDLAQLRVADHGKMNLYIGPEFSNRICKTSVHSLLSFGDQFEVVCCASSLQERHYAQFTLSEDADTRVGTITMLCQGTKTTIARVRKDNKNIPLFHYPDYFVDIVPGIDIAFVVLLCLSLEYSLHHRHHVA